MSGTIFFRFLASAVASEAIRDHLLPAGRFFPPPRPLGLSKSSGPDRVNRLSLITDITNPRSLIADHYDAQISRKILQTSPPLEEETVICIIRARALHRAKNADMADT